MRKILIMGATSAIAEATARLFAARGDALFLVGRNPDRLGAIADDLCLRGAPLAETFVMDAREGVVDHDLNLLGFAIESGRALVIALNKWDGMEPGERDYVKTELERRLFFVSFADIHFISALHGTGVGHLYKSVQDSFRSAITRWPTSRLTQILEDAVREHQPPMVNNRRIKLRYAHLGGANPPIIEIGRAHV